MHRISFIVLIVIAIGLSVWAEPAVSAESRPVPESMQMPPGDWYVLSDPPFVIYHEPQDETPAKELLELFQRHAPDFVENLNLSFPEQIRVFIAPNEGRFRYLTRGTPHWTGGLAYPRRGIMILQAPRMMPSRGQFSVTALHELLHIITYQREGYHLPRWLGEGLAMYMSGETMYKHRTPLARAVVFNKTFTLDQIEGMMRLGPEQARVAYLQSISFVEFIVDRYGWDAIAALVKGYGTGANPDSLFAEVTGREFYDLEIAYHQELKDRYRWFNIIAWINFDTIVWTAAALLVMIVGGTAIIRRRRELHSEESYIDESQADPRLYEGDPLWDEDDPPPGSWYVEDDDYWR